MIPWMRHVMAQPNGYNPVCHAIFFNLHTSTQNVYHITACYCFLLLFLAIAQFGGAIGGIVSNRCKFNILQYIQTKDLSNLTFCFSSSLGVKRVTKGKKPFQIDLTPFQEWSGLVDREHNATVHWFQQGVFLFAVLVIVSGIAAVDDLYLNYWIEACGCFVLFHQLYHVIISRKINVIYCWLPAFCLG